MGRTYDTWHIADDLWCASIRFYCLVHLEGLHHFHDPHDDEASTILLPILVPVFLGLTTYVSTSRPNPREMIPRTFGRII